MTVKIKTKVLTTFLNKARLEGTQLLTEAVLKFEEDGLKINANTSTQQARVMAWLKTSAFSEYENIGNVAMNDLSNVVKVIDGFGDEITLKKEGNLLTISGKTKNSNKKVGIELPHEGFLSTDSGEPNLEFEETFTTEASVLKDIFKAIKVNADVILSFKTEDKKVIFNNSGKYKFTYEIEAPSCKGGTKVVMGIPFMDVITNLDGSLEVSIKTDFPAKIREVTEHSVITLIVAPRSDEE